MSYTKQDILSRLSKCHDELKNHPFRTSFEVRYIGDYKYLLYQLTEIWADLIWRCNELTDFEQQRFRMFDEWIHDFRQYLRTWDKETFPMQYFDYYEQMLQITHNFIDSGDHSVYYNLNRYFSNKGSCVKSTRYEWITAEDCGIDSIILPRYLPVGITLVTDDKAIQQHFSSGWYARTWQVEAGIDLDFWQKHTKPVLEWLNKQKRIDETTRLKCMVITPSPCRPKEEE